jgi:hypothetical protein
MTDPIFWSGIATAGYHHVNCFDGSKRREHYDDFYCKAFQVVDVNVLSFADYFLALLVDSSPEVYKEVYTRSELYNELVVTRKDEGKYDFPNALEIF